MWNSWLGVSQALRRIIWACCKLAELTLVLPLMICCYIFHYLVNLHIFPVCLLSATNVLCHFFLGGPVVHRSDYTYRGGYHYHHYPPRIPPPVVYQPIPFSPPVTYYRPPVPIPPYHHRFKGPVPPHKHITKGLSPPLAHRPYQSFKVPYKLKGPCPTKPDPTVPTPPVVLPPTLLPVPEPTVKPTLTATTAAPLTTIMPVVVTKVGTSAPVMLPVSTQSGFITTSSAASGRILLVRFAYQLLSLR